MKKAPKMGPLIGPSIDTFSILFLLKKHKKNKRNLYPIYVRVTLNGKRIELSTRRWININEWDQNKQRPKLLNQTLKTLNYYLEQIRNKFYLEHQKLFQKDIPFTVIELKNAYLNIGDGASTVLQQVEDHNKAMYSQIPKNYSYGTYKNYKTLKNILFVF